MPEDVAESSFQCVPCGMNWFIKTCDPDWSQENNLSAVSGGQIM